MSMTEGMQSHQAMSLYGYLNSFPAYTPRSPNSSSILSNWLYLARRQDRLGAPVLICPLPSPTTKSAMKESSVSPDRCETMTPQWQSLLCSQAWMDSERVPIWLTFKSRALHDFFWMPVLILCWLVTRRSSPTICTRSPILAVRARQPSQSSWSKGSSMDTMGYLPTYRSQSAPNSALVRWGTVVDSFSSLKCRSYFLVVSLQNSEAAQSIPISTMSLCPDSLMAAWRSSSASSPSLTVGAKPPSSPTLVALRPYFFLMIFMRWWYTSEPTRMAWVKLVAPVGKIMNSCMARPFPPCLPPLMTLKAGVGSMYFFLPVRLVKDWMCQQRGWFLAAAPARATANETERIAFAPISFLQQPQSLKVPSNSLTMQLSISTCLVGSLPTKAGDSTEFTLFTALETPLPMYSSFFPSLNSTAQYLPVDAPEGTEARKTPRSVVTSVSMVGLPRESKICLALICLMEERQQWSGLARIRIIY